MAYRSRSLQDGDRWFSTLRSHLLGFGHSSINPFRAFPRQTGRPSRSQRSRR